MLETWYIMEDGSVGDPLEIAPGDDGILRHSDGRAVAYGPHGPRSRGCVDAEAERAKVAEKRDTKREAISPEDRELKANDGRRGYKTRAPKAD